MSNIYEYSVMLKEPKSEALDFFRIETKICNVYEFAEMLQQQIKKGNISGTANIVSIHVSDIKEGVSE